MPSANSPVVAPISAASEENGQPLVREDEGSRQSRRRSERLAYVSRYLLVTCGAITLGAALPLWLLHPSMLAVGLVLFGIVLVALGLAQHFLLQLERSRWPDQAILWPDGVELVLHNGEVRAVEWNDPKLAFDLFRRPVRGDPAGEILLEWKMGGYVPPCPITEDGFDHLQAAIVAHNLGMAEFRHGRRTQEVRIFEVRPARAAPSAMPSRPGSATLEP